MLLSITSDIPLIASYVAPACELSSYTYSLYTLLDADSQKLSDTDDQLESKGIVFNNLKNPSGLSDCKLLDSALYKFT